MAGDATAQAIGQLFRTGQHVLVERIAQGGVVADGGAQFAQAAFQVAGQYRILARQISPQIFVHTLPQALHIFLHCRVVDHLLLECINLGRQGRVFAQAAHVVTQPQCIVLAQRMLGLREDGLQFFQPRTCQAVGQ